MFLVNIVVFIMARGLADEICADESRPTTKPMDKKEQKEYCDSVHSSIVSFVL
jgi:hypothetical protein